MKRILFISAWYPTDENQNFGIFIKEHARSIATTNCSIQVLAIVVQRGNKFLNITYRKDVDESGIPTTKILIYSRFRDVLYHLVSFQKWIVYKYYKKHIAPDFIPDIIHSNVIFPAGIIGDYLARKLNKKHIITEHWSKINTFLKKMPCLATQARNAYTRADMIFPVSVFLQNNMQSLLRSIEHDKFIVIPNVVSSDIFQFKHKQTNDKTIKFCAVASWITKKEPDKYPELFIEALAKIQSGIDKKIELIMVGAGDRVEGLRDLCRQMNINTHFTGYLPKEQIAELLCQSDFFIHASRIETFGIVAIEALMTGTPVICSKVGALPEIINDTNGILSENNLHDWISGINNALSKDFDREKMAAEVKDKYSYKTVGALIENQYTRLLRN